MLQPPPVSTLPQQGRALPAHERVQGIVYSVCIVLAPLAMMLGRILFFPPPHGDGVAWIATAAAHPAAVGLELTVGVVGTMLFPIGVIGMARLALRRAPWLAMTGGALALLGWGTGPFWVGQDTLTRVMAQMGGGARLAELWDRYNASAVTNAYLAIFVIGHFFGPLLLGIALTRMRTIPVWAPIVMAASIPLHVLAVLGGAPWILDPIGYGMLAIASVPAAIATLTTPAPEPTPGA